MWTQNFNTNSLIANNYSEHLRYFVLTLPARSLLAEKNFAKGAFNSIRMPWIYHIPRQGKLDADECKPLLKQYGGMHAMWNLS